MKSFTEVQKFKKRLSQTAGANNDYSELFHKLCLKKKYFTPIDIEM